GLAIVAGATGWAAPPPPGKSLRPNGFAPTLPPCCLRRTPTRVPPMALARGSRTGERRLNPQTQDTSCQIHPRPAVNRRPLRASLPPRPRVRRPVILHPASAPAAAPALPAANARRPPRPRPLPPAPPAAPTSPPAYRW